MADPSLFRLRVVFAKSGRLCQLSHLEIARTLERIVRRAQLPFLPRTLYAGGGAGHIVLRRIGQHFQLLDNIHGRPPSL